MTIFYILKFHDFTSMNIEQYSNVRGDISIGFTEINKANIPYIKVYPFTGLYLCHHALLNFTISNIYMNNMVNVEVNLSWDSTHSLKMRLVFLYELDFFFT